MDNTNINSKTADTELLERELDGLLASAKKLRYEIDFSNKQSRENVEQISIDVDNSINKIQKLCGDLDLVEKTAGDELDALVLKQVEDVA
jgi:hypothetical protein